MLGSEPSDVQPISGLTSGAICPEDSSLSYDNFGRGLVQAYCRGCHTAAVVGPARAAPPDRNFDDLPSIRALAVLIDQQAGSGPLASHETMPPTDPRPTAGQRWQLGEWLACGAP